MPKLTTTQIGAKLERDFGAWLEENLGYNKVEYNIPMNGKVSERFYDCDIHAVKGVIFSDQLRKIGVALILFVAIIFGFEASGIPSGVTLGTIIFIAVIGFVIGMIGKKQKTTHTWVECKEHKSKVKRHQVVKLKSAIDDVNKVENHKWYPDTIMIASKSGFDADAINFAREYGIKLYEREDDGFIEII